MKKTVIILAIALGFSFSTFATTTTSNNFKIVKAENSVSPFCASIAKGDFETVKKLIELGADVNQKSNGMTPLMYAAKFNRVEILKLLVENGADLKKKSDKGYTAEKYAELSNAQDAIKAINHFESQKKRKA
ncbi:MULTISPECIES: ankyrin repeat domain-containing protein [Flavobacteriaceae]|uniref:Ankyrin repeat protein n=2 Tax=Flavobacteriaceae TaxID=49546 RepID=A0ABN1JIR4_9FLAO|nr:MULTISPECIES: ankyrin repeat domain-containing protein [Flavobacteriaceae]TBV27777.1 ankyrin repeat domain-containing protein [Meridianimaribacter sp. CL38]TDY14060.1 ankyrin repeat protein [Meridianimaribacter flavus]